MKKSRQWYRSIEKAIIVVEQHFWQIERRYRKAKNTLWHYKYILKCTFIPGYKDSFTPVAHPYCKNVVLTDALRERARETFYQYALMRSRKGKGKREKKRPDLLDCE